MRGYDGSQCSCGRYPYGTHKWPECEPKVKVVHIIDGSVTVPEGTKVVYHRPPDQAGIKALTAHFPARGLGSQGELMVGYDQAVKRYPATFPSLERALRDVTCLYTATWQWPDDKGGLVTNHTCVPRQKFSFGNTMLEVQDALCGDDWTKAADKALFDHLRGIEQALIFGNGKMRGAYQLVGGHHFYAEKFQLGILRDLRLRFNVQGSDEACITHEWLGEISLLAKL